MNITLVPLAKIHFSLLLRWLLTPHVQQWWDSDIAWTKERIVEKYASYVEGYKFENGICKPIEAFIITVGAAPVGYIQAYNAYDFSREPALVELPDSLMAFDVFIGESEYLNRGIGSHAIMQLLLSCVGKYEYAFVDPVAGNAAAIRMYEKIGFKKIDSSPVGVSWMIKLLISAQREKL